MTLLCVTEFKSSNIKRTNRLCTCAVCFWKRSIAASTAQTSKWKSFYRTLMQPYQQLCTSHTHTTHTHTHTHTHTSLGGPKSRGPWEGWRLSWLHNALQHLNDICWHLVTICLFAVSKFVLSAGQQVSFLLGVHHYFTLLSIFKFVP